MRIEKRTTTNKGVRYFLKGMFPRENIPSGNFPNAQFLKRLLPNVGRALRLGQTLKVAAWEKSVGKEPNK